MRRLSILPGVLLAAVGAPALASDQPGTAADAWREEKTSTDLRPDGITPTNGLTDAGQHHTNANLTRGAGPLTTIIGSLAAGPMPNSRVFLDADLFCIQITDPANFSATPAGGNDWTLSLFHLDGRGIAFNDNRTDSATSLNARLGSGLVATLPVGSYLLGISRNGGNAAARQLTRPLDALGNLMFSGPVNLVADDAGGPNDLLRRMEVGPINPAAILSGWETQNPTGLLGFNQGYTITLTGAGFHQLPAPGAACLLGMGGLLMARRRR